MCFVLFLSNISLLWCFVNFSYHSAHTLSPFFGMLPLFIQWKTAVWILVTLHSHQELFPQPFSIYSNTKCSCQIPWLLGGLPDLFLMIIVISTSFSSVWVLWVHVLLITVSQQFIGWTWDLHIERRVLLLDERTVIYQGQTTVGVSCNFQLSLKNLCAGSLDTPWWHNTGQHKHRKSHHLECKKLLY